MPDLQQTAVTPYRATSVAWDIAESVLTEGVFIRKREGGTLRPSAVSNCVRLASGVWVLKPVNTLDLIHERTAAHDYIVRLADWNAHSIVSEVFQQRKFTELSGISADSSVDSAGDDWCLKRVAAGATWNNVLSTAGTGPTLPTTSYPVDRLMATKAAHAPNTGYVLRIKLPTGGAGSPDIFFGFQFGGELIGDTSQPHTGYGLFYVALKGDGTALLYEWIDGAWSQVASFRFAAAELGSSFDRVSLWIIPHWPRFLEFRGNATVLSEQGSLIENLVEVAITAIAAGKTNVYVHETTNRGAAAAGPGPGFLKPITGAGMAKVDVRRDLRLAWQVSRIGYEASGTITDRPFTLPYGYANDHILRLNKITYEYVDEGTGSPVTSTTLTGQTAAGGTLTAANENFTLGGVTYAFSGYELTAENKYRAQIGLATSEASGSRFHSPAFLAYAILRNGHIGTIANGVKTGGRAQSFSITGPGYQPDHESGFVAIEDEKNELAFLRARGGASVRIETAYDAPGVNKSVLFEGYLGRITATRKGKRGNVYPSPEWRLLECELVGKWDRLADRFFYFRPDFSNAADSPSGPSGNDVEAWKVTDVVRFVLNSQGFPDSQINISDNPIRLFKTAPNSVDLLHPAPGTSIVEYLQILLRDYLNAWLVWDANAGAAGQWRVISPPTGTEPVVWAFVTTGAASGKLQYQARSYGANVSPILEPGPLQTWIVRPEGNVLTVSGGYVTVPGGGQVRVQRTLYNPTSWNSPTHTTADTDDLDYIGRIVPIEYVDVSITDQLACDFLARRIFDLACRGEKRAEFTAELVLIDAAALEPTVYTTRLRRPLRAGDTVTIDGERWIIESANPAWESDLVQLCHYEARLFRPANTLSR